MNTPREATLRRKTNETEIAVEINLDGSGEAMIDTGIGFLDHMLHALTKHARWDLVLRCKGDLHVDDHHTAEDCAIALGKAIDQALGERKGIRRFGYAYAPLDEALARAVVDLSGRAWHEVHLDLKRERLGDLSCENIPHIFQSLAIHLRAAIHLDMIRGVNDHHKAEAAFKALALALREACAREGHDEVPSTKGTL